MPWLQSTKPGRLCIRSGHATLAHCSTRRHSRHGNVNNNRKLPTTDQPPTKDHHLYRSAQRAHALLGSRLLPLRLLFINKITWQGFCFSNIFNSLYFSRRSVSGLFTYQRHSIYSTRFHFTPWLWGCFSHTRWQKNIEKIFYLPLRKGKYQIYLQLQKSRALPCAYRGNENNGNDSRVELTVNLWKIKSHNELKSK